MENLKVDWGFTPEKDRREYGRITHGYLSKFYGEDSLVVYISTNNRDYNGLIIDLSIGGILISTKYLIKEKTVKVSFLIGRKRIITVADIKREKVVDNGYNYGMMFINLKSRDHELLNDLFVNKILKWER